MRPFFEGSGCLQDGAFDSEQERVHLPWLLEELYNAIGSVHSLLDSEG